MRVVEYLLLLPGPVGPVFARWGGILFGAYVALLFSLALLCSVARVLNGRNSFKNQVIERIWWWGAGLQVLGMVLLALRVIDWPVLSMRLLLYGQLAAEVVAVAYLFRWFQKRYPAALAAYEWEERKRAYLPRAAGGAIESLRRKAPARRRR